MKRIALLAVLAATLIFSIAIQANETITLEGTYVWDGGSTSGPLKAVFRPTETEGEWEVAFYFEFRERDHTYTGTAEGSLTAGDLSGTVMNERKRRTFTFEGAIADGTFSGTHAEVYKGRSSSTGTLTLKSP